MIIGLVSNGAFFCLHYNIDFFVKYGMHLIKDNNKRYI
jgi:hypothetical protein